MKITDLPKKIAKLNNKDKTLFKRYFTISLQESHLVVPKGLYPWITKTFGSVAAVKKQKVLNILNNFTYEGALYNQLRSNRPMVSQEVNLEEYQNGDIFVNPKDSTPEDTFGRIYGTDDISAANIAKYDDKHGLIIFNKFNPLKVSKEELENHFSSAMKWFEKAHAEDKKAVYPILLWNSLFKSGASVVHGHMQTLLSDIPYGRIGRKNALVQEYKTKYKTNYFDDLYKIHESLGLGFTNKKIKIYTSLTPAKEKETVIISEELNKEVIDQVYYIVEAFKKLGVNSFNMFAILKPYTKWNLPIIIRIVDRGSISNKTTDVGALELFTQHAVIGSDPYQVIKEIKKQSL